MPTNVVEFEKSLKKAADQIPFAISLAINRVGSKIQRAQVQRMHDVFTVRKVSFIGRPETAHRSAVKRTKKASKRDPVLELAIRPPGGISRAGIITRHQADTSRRPKGGGTLAVPDKARRGKTGNIPKRFRPKELDLVSHGRGRRVFRGKQRTFLVRDSKGGTIYRRTSRRRGGRRRKRGSGGGDPFAGTEVLYQLRKRTTLVPRLQFFRTAEKVFQRSFRTEFRKAYREALASAR